MVVNALREWKLACPKGGLDLVFPNSRGRVESLAPAFRAAEKVDFGWRAFVERERNAATDVSRLFV